MNNCKYVVILALTLGNAVVASRINMAAVGDHAESKGQMCHLKETEHALGYGLFGIFPVKSCTVNCKWNYFLSEIFTQKIMVDPEVADEGKTCKCQYAPRYWEGAGSSKFWYQFRINSARACTQEQCQETFFMWSNMYLKKAHYPGDNEKVPVDHRMESQANYELSCSTDIPEAIVLPSPGSKVTELRLRIAKSTDPEEIARLQALLDELLGDKAVEVYEYDLEGDWGPEHHADTSDGGDLHSYYLKPCKSNLGGEATDLHEILELCGPGEMGVSMKEGELRYSYKTDGDWGPEQTCTIDAELCKLLEDEAAKDGWKLLSFRLKPCTTPSSEKVLTDLAEVLAENGCGAPTLGLSFLPVKVSAARKFDQDAPEDELEFPCP